MKLLRQLLEAKYDAGGTKVWYYERYPEYDKTKEFETTIDRIDAAYRDDAEWNQLNRHIGKTYAFKDMLNYWPAVRRELERTGTYTSTWEEGYHAISTKGPNEPYQALLRLWGDDV